MQDPTAHKPKRFQEQPTPFLVETYDRIQRQRVKWNEKNREVLKEASTNKLPEKKYGSLDPSRKIIEIILPTIKMDNIEASRNRRKKPIRDGTHIPGVSELKKEHTIKSVGLCDKNNPCLTKPDNELTLAPPMRPVLLKQKEILYKELPNHGRKVYLEIRKEVIPEKRYYFMETSGWECGWRLDDSRYYKQAPIHGRSMIFTRDGMSRTGAHPDPKYYQDPDVLGNSSKVL